MQTDPFQNRPEFLHAFRRGEAWALDRVYRLYKRPLRNFILRGFAFKSEGRNMYFAGRLSDADVDDILHETFRRAFGERARNTYDGIRLYKNYLFTIARNAVINDLTAKQRQIPVGEALMRDSSPEEMTALEHWVRSRQASLSAQHSEATDEQVENLEVYGLVVGFMEHLEDEDRDFFEIRFLASSSQEKTARAMGWNRAKVRKVEARLRRAFLAHACGTGYLENRAEGRMVRRVKDPAHHAQVFARSRDLWRHRTAEQDNEFLVEAA